MVRGRATGLLAAASISLILLIATNETTAAAASATASAKPVPASSHSSITGKTKPLSSGCTKGPSQLYNGFGLVLAVGSGNMVNGGTVLQWSNVHSADQYWYFDYYNCGDRLRVRNAKTDSSGRQYCLDVVNGSRKEGARVQIWTCNTNTQQSWFWANSAYFCKVDGCQLYWELTNDNSFLGLAISGGQPTVGAGAIQWDRTGSADQFWRSF
jgi:Ricin-type beta-trefoil lectin domain